MILNQKKHELMLIKTKPEKTFSEFLSMVQSITTFKSKTGKTYIVISLEASILKFVRESTQKEWKVDLKDIHKAYMELKQFRTIDFKPYVPRKQSPSLGLLITLKLLKFQ